MTDLLYYLYKYDVPGPRYTSYPTVPAWTEVVGDADYVQSLASLNAADPLSLYLHLPFCESLCHFCGCMQVITRDHSRSRPYVERVMTEIKHVASSLPSRMRATQLHFGGGTPNFLQPDELSELVETVQSSFALDPNAEIAIEMHPRTSTRAFCEALAHLSFNRISLGVQDFDPKVQALINRHQTYEMTRDMLAMLCDLGFKSINFDLIYGLPGQRMDHFVRTLEQVLELSPSRLAVYSYAHVPWVRPVQRSFKDEDLPTPEEKLALFQRAYDTFTSAGYVPIGMDHFARRDDDLAHAALAGTLHRNFMGYSTQADAHQIGFGVSAISYVGGNYFQNHKKLERYNEAVKESRFATFRGHILSRADAMRRDLIMKIMCDMAVDITVFEKKWNIHFATAFALELEALSGFVADGLLAVSPTHMRVMGRGHLFLRNIAMVFDTYLDEIKRRAVNPTFSRTV
jgi:oxygen-independent coproporphyrinogen-3 oxidase